MSETPRNIFSEKLHEYLYVYRMFYIYIYIYANMDQYYVGL